MSKRKKRIGKAKAAFRLQNQWRVQHGARVLIWSAKMRVTAKAACLVIIKRGELRHDPFWYRGLLKALGNVEVSENIGWGQDAPAEIIRGWDESEIHDRIMRKKNSTHGAIASIYSRKLRKRVWVAHYADLTN